MGDKSLEESLYRRLGGYEGIAAIVDDLFAMLRADPRFSRFGMGRGVDSHKRSRQLLVDQLGELTGGPCFYIGRNMKTSHAGLGITDAEWQLNREYTREVMRKRGLGEREQEELIAIFERYKSDIVEVPTQRASG